MSYMVFTSHPPHLPSRRRRLAVAAWVLRCLLVNAGSSASLSAIYRALCILSFPFLLNRDFFLSVNVYAWQCRLAVQTSAVESEPVILLVTVRRYIPNCRYAVWDGDRFKV